MKMLAIRNYINEYKSYSKTFSEISFGKTSIYAKKIDNNQTPLKFDSLTQAQNSLSIPVSDISQVLSGTRPATKGYMFIKASDIEDKDGNINKDKFDNFVLASRKVGLSKALYAKKIEHGGEFIRFDCVSDAHEALKIPRTSICQCMSGEIRFVGGYIFIKADEVEDEYGNFDIVSAQGIHDEVLAYKTSKALYAKKIYGDEIPVRFENQAKASRLLGVTQTRIGECLNNKKRQSNGYMFIKASDIEDKDGNIIDKKMDKFLSRVRNYKNSKAIYVKQLGNDNCIQKYPNAVSLKEALNIDSGSISKCLQGKRCRVKNFALISAGDVEDRDGGIDEKKLAKFLLYCKKLEKNKEK